MSKGAKPSTQQSSLMDMWNDGGKGKKAAHKIGSESTKQVASSSSDGLTPMEVDNNVFKRKKPATLENSAARKTKKRCVVDSDDEVPPALEQNSSKPPSSKPSSTASNAEPSKKAGLKTPPPAERSKKPAEATKRARVSKRAVVEEKDDEELGSPAPLPATDDELPATSADEAEDRADEGEDELTEDEEDGLAKVHADKTNSRKDEVDVEGGWEVGAPVPYAALAKTFSLVEATTKRLEKTSLLTALLQLVIQRSAPGDTESLLLTVYLCVNRLCPNYVGIELGLGESLLVKAISESTGRSLTSVKSDLKAKGDLGLVAMNSKNSQKTLFRPKPLTVPFVFSELKKIAMSTGNSSQAKKVSIITKLLAACQGEEAKYIVRSLEGKLRIGNAERTVLVAVAHAAVLAAKEKEGKRWVKEKLASRLQEGANTIKQVYSELPTYDKVIPALLEFGIDRLKEKCKLTPGIPLKPMLARPTKAIGEVLDRFENERFTCEYKYDGERAQIHRTEDGRVFVFSRNSEDMSKKYPDLVEQLPHCIKDTTKSFVIDAEAVAIDKDTKKLMPFQELSRRKRKDVKLEDIQVRVCLFAFDLLYLNGEPLLQKSLVERRELLRQHFEPVDGEFQFAKASDAETTEEIQSFLEESVKDGCEGLMVKMLESEASYYQPSRRTVHWLKLKKDYLAGIGDSLDLVAIGGYYGKGKRTNVYGAFLLACYDADSEEYQTICKIGTGFSEEMLQSHWGILKPLEIQKPRGDVKIGGAKPDVWFEPKIVWEVLTADLSLSPIYTAAQGLVEERGISLRFPRFIRVRDDKSADDATGPEQIAEMYERQALAQGGGKKRKEKDDGDSTFW
ncbi:ATP-dependent DNA ligase [Heliocybe sulcata]|uniref:DNA ligase n=1 Tax=Heliocybe sulcata TaxID=5364 RepID=A0A5C3NJM0_9AGAM|nr:ATP-dependent DNA ligase [Heliocybe sulcata]